MRSLRYRREALGLTRAQLAEAAGISSHYIRAIEHGQPCSTGVADHIEAALQAAAAEIIARAEAVLDPTTTWDGRLPEDDDGRADNAADVTTAAGGGRHDAA